MNEFFVTNPIFLPPFVSSMCTNRVFSNLILIPPSISLCTDWVFSNLIPTPLFDFFLVHECLTRLAVPNVKLRNWEEFEPLWFKLLASVLLQAKGVHNLIQTLGMVYGSCILMSLCQLGDEWGGVKWKHIATINNVVKSFAFVIRNCSTSLLCFLISSLAVDDIHSRLL